MQNKVVQDFLNAFKPNRSVSAKALLPAVVFSLLVIFLYWEFEASRLIPKPQEIPHAWVEAVNVGLFDHLASSLSTLFQAIFIASVISLLLAYSTVIPAMRPIVAFLGKLRYLSFVGLTFPFMLVFHDGHSLKLGILTFAMAVYFIPGIAAIVASIPDSAYDYARTLRMGEWRIVWDVVVLGKLPDTIESIRQNSAMGFMMVSFVETLVRSEGGIGAMLYDQDHKKALAVVIAIQLTLIVLATSIDWIWGLTRNILCPYIKYLIKGR